MRDPIIILHGWGLRKTLYIPLANLLRKAGYGVHLLDMPGFGEEPLKTHSMNLDDYVEYVRQYMKINNILRVIFIGHSFGGRVALKYAWRYPKEVSRVIFTGVPIIREQSFYRLLLFLSAQLGGLVFRLFPRVVQLSMRKFLYFLLGEWDYYNAGSLKQVFKNIVNEDLIHYARELKTPTLLVWGKNDAITPVSTVAKIKKIMPEAQTVIISGVGHKLPYEKPGEFFKALKAFL